MAKVGKLLLRGATCVTWMFAFLMALFEAFYSMDCEQGSHEQNVFYVRMFVCLVVGITGACSHAYLIQHDGTKDEGDI